MGGIRLGPESDFFEVEDSKLSEALQVADLFTSSISRRLNAAGGRRQPKAEFAEYFVDVVNFTSATGFKLCPINKPFTCHGPKETPPSS